jgi:methionyl-tRNA formyltransferase
MEAIYEAGGNLDLIVSLKDDVAVKKSGRVFVDEFALRNRIPVLKVEHINDADVLPRIRELDWLFIVGWSQIAGPEVLDAPRLGALGMHPTLLPEGRGRAAIPWAILKGLSKTGVTMFKLDEGVDTGPILAQQEIALSSGTTATDLYARVNATHVALIKQTLPDLLTGRAIFQPQDEQRATEWPGRRPDDGAIDLSGSVNDAERLVRALTHPYPGAFYQDQNGNKVIVWAAEIVEKCPDGLRVQFKDGYLSLVDWEIAS